MAKGSAPLTLTPLEALEGAIEMLRAVANGHQYPALEYHERLQSYEEARDGERRRQLADAVNRDQIRRLGMQRRAS